MPRGRPRKVIPVEPVPIEVVEPAEEVVEEPESIEEIEEELPLRTRSKVQLPEQIPEQIPELALVQAQEIDVPAESEKERKKRIKFELNKVSRNKTAITRTKNLNEYKKKASLFDSYLDGTLTYEQVLLNGYKPKNVQETFVRGQETKVAPRKMTAKEIHDLLNS